MGKQMLLRRMPMNKVCVAGKYMEFVYVAVTMNGSFILRKKQTN